MIIRTEVPSTAMSHNSLPSVVLAKFASKSNPSHTHEVRRGKDGNVYCTCPSWRFQHNSPTDRTCKHIEAWKAETVVGGRTLLDMVGPGPEAIRPVRRSRKARSSSLPVGAPLRRRLWWWGASCLTQRLGT